MNIAAIASQLSRLPDQALVQEMRAPSGAIPQFLIMTELQRRQEMRRGASPGMPQQTTVAQDIMSGTDGTRVSANGGLGTLPVSTPRQVPGMASGGRVSFTDARDAMANINNEDPDARSAAADYLAALQTRFVGPSPSWMPPSVPAAMADGVASVGATFTDPKDAMANINSQNPVLRAAAARFLASQQGQYNPAPQEGAPLPEGSGAPEPDMSWRKRGDWFPGQSIISSLFSPHAGPMPGMAYHPGASGASAPSPESDGGSPISLESWKPDGGMSYWPERTPENPGAFPDLPESAAENPRQAPARTSGVAGLARSSSSANTATPSAAASSGGTSFDEMIGNTKKFLDSGLFPDTVGGLKGLIAQRQGQLDSLQASDPWLALASAGFKMASGTSPYFAENVGPAGQQLASDLREQKIDSLTRQLQLDGLSEKVAEAEATRRVNAANASMRFMERQDSIAQRREAAADNADARRLQYQLMHEDRMARLANMGSANLDRQNGQLITLYNGTQSDLTREMSAAQDWVQKTNMTPAGISNPVSIQDAPNWDIIQQKRSILNSLEGHMSQRLGIPTLAPMVAPAAAQGREDPLGIR